VKNPAAETAGRKIKEDIVPALEGRGLRGG